MQELGAGLGEMFGGIKDEKISQKKATTEAVSYTHLTLPTILRV